jgi:hypothetical protein
MCQSLVSKVAQSQQLQSVAAPEVLNLFEDWMEELENEVLGLVKQRGAHDPAGLAEELGFSLSGMVFLITKLQNEGKI